MDTESWPQDGGMMKPVEEKINPNNYVVSSSKAAMEKRSARPPQSKEQALNCPRCSSTNTKFCYYNNYSLSQPRYFCKNCRRYWTEGGSIRNVPVGGGSRKNKRSITIASSAGAAITATTASTQAFLRIPDLSPQSLSLLPPPHHDPNPRSHGGVHGGTPHDLGLNTYLGLSQFVHPRGPRPDQTHIAASAAPSHHRSAAPPTATELFRTGMASRGLNSFMQGPAPEADAGLSFPAEFKGFPPVEGFGVGRGGQHGFQENSNERLLFPFGELGQISSSSGSGVDQSNKGQESSGGWWNMNNGVLGGGSW